MKLNLFSKRLAVWLVLCALTSAAPAADRISEDEIVEAMTASAAGPVYSAVEKYFPEDAAYWRKELAKVAKRKSGEIVFPRKVLSLGAEIRKRHAPALQFASGESLRKVMAVQYAMHALLKDNTDACNRLIMSGPKSLSNEELEMVVEISSEVEAQFFAMHEGATNPVTHAQPTDAAWQGFYDTFIAMGGTNAEYDLLFEPKDDPSLCSAFLNFFKVLRDGDYEGADPVRALIVPSLVGS